MTALRNRLPDRRAHELYRFECGGLAFIGGIGRFEDGRIAEVFVNAAKVGSAVETSAQDAARCACSPWSTRRQNRDLSQPDPPPRDSSLRSISFPSSAMIANFSLSGPNWSK